MPYLNNFMCSYVSLVSSQSWRLIFWVHHSWLIHFLGASGCSGSNFFSFEGEFYEQTTGVAMGSSLSPIVANLFMEKFEKEALDSYPLKPSRWKRYVDDTNVVWPHGEDELRKFLSHLNSISPNIKFTMELEENGSIPFLDVLLTRK